MTNCCEQASFEWGKGVLSSIRNAYDVNDMNRDPKNAFHKPKTRIMEDRGQKNHFIELCNRCSLCTVTASEVYDVFLQKKFMLGLQLCFVYGKKQMLKKKAQRAVNCDKKKRNT